MSNNPCHRSQITRLKRAEGQIRGVIGLIEKDAYCIDILNQLKAAQKALSSIEANILETHLNNCIKDVMLGGEDAEQKIVELTKIIKR